MTEPMGERGRQGAAPLGGYTPGPWGFWGPDYLSGEKAWHVTAGEHGIVGYGIKSVEDTRLIAAAPELLEALERLCEYPVPSKYDIRWGLAVAAIAKVRGEQ